MRENSRIKERILQLIDSQGITKEKFCNLVEINSSNLRGVTLESDPNARVVAKILTKYPQLSADWLLLGKGEMFKDSQGDSQHSSQTSAESLSASSTASADLSDQISLLQQLQEENKRLHHKLIQTQEALIKTQQQLLDLIAQHIDNR